MYFVHQVLFVNQDDNYPNDFYRYYVTIDTGVRGGCDASVAIKIFGKESASNVHVLQVCVCRCYKLM